MDNQNTTPTPPAGQVKAVAIALWEKQKDMLGPVWFHPSETWKGAPITAQNEWIELAKAALKASGAEHIAGLAKASIDIASFAQHDEDCKINDWENIPECTCGYTSAQGALCDILEALPPELRGK